jgi:hypothetical protein
VIPKGTPVKRLLAVLTTAVLSAGALTAAGPAQAAEGDTCTINVASTLVITSASSPFQAPLGDDCEAAGVVEANWVMTNVRTGEQLGLTYDDVTGSPWLWLDTYSFGAWNIEPDGAWNSLDEQITQNSTSFVVKAASKASQAVTRSGSNVTVKVGASYYNARLNRQIPWVGAAVQIQTSSALDGRWTTVATGTTGADGTVSKAFRAPSARYWRVLTPTTASVFGRYSVPVYR